MSESKVIIMTMIVIAIILLASYYKKQEVEVATNPLGVSVIEPVKVLALEPLSVTVTSPLEFSPSTPLDVNVTNPVEITSSTPLDVNVLNAVEITSSTPLDVNVLNQVEITSSTPLEITSSTPLDVNVLNPVEITSSTPLEITSSTPLDVNVTNPVEITSSTPLRVEMSKYEDAFGRLRTSDQYTLADYKHIYFSDENYIDVVSGTGAITYNQDQSSVVLNVTSGTDSAIHQTRSYHHYQPGKSQLINSSFVFGTPTPNVIRRTGLFDNFEGIFLEMNGLDFSWNIRSDNLNQTSARGSWLDPMDGSGPSGVSLDFTKTQLIIIDFQWLGVGQVRCGFGHNGRNIISNVFYNSNNLEFPYLRSPSLPVRCELVSTGGSGTMKQICATVISEGGYSEAGRDFNISSGHVGRSCPQAGTRYPLLAIRLKNTFKGLPNRVSVRLSNISIFAQTSGVLWELWKLPSAVSLTGTVNWIDINSGSAMEYSKFPEGIDVTDCLLISSGFISADGANKGSSPITLSDPTKTRQLLLSQNFTSDDSEIFVLLAIPLGSSNNSGVLGFASIQWKEVY